MEEHLKENSNYVAPEAIPHLPWLRQQLSYTDGWKYQTTEYFVWKLVNKFDIKEDYQNRYYGITKSGYYFKKPGCCWNGADLFPDFKWIMPGSGVHDGLLWLVAKGIIPESQNNLIDAELGEVIKATLKGKTKLVRFVIKARAWYVKIGTHLAFTRKGEAKTIHKIKIANLIIDA